MAEERGVIFRLRAEADPGAGDALREFGDLVGKTQKEIWQSAATEAKRAAASSVKAFEEAENQKLTIVQQMMQRRSGVIQDAEKGVTQSIRQEAKSREAALAAGQSAATDAHRKTAEVVNQAMQQRADAADGVEKSITQSVQQEAKIRAAAKQSEQSAAIEAKEKESVKAKLAEEKQTETQKRELEKRQKDEDKARTAREKSVVAEQKKKADATKKAAEVHERASADIERQNQITTDGFTKAAEGAVKFGRGIAAMGIASEENVEKMVRMLVRLQASVDLARGSVEIYRGITEGVKAYRAAVAATLIVEEAQLAVRTKSAAAVVVGSAAGTGVAGAAGVAAAGAGAGLATSLAGAASAVVAALTSIPALIAAAIGGIAFAANVGGSRDFVAGRLQESGGFDPGTLGGKFAAAKDFVFPAAEASGGVSLATEQRSALVARDKAERLADARRFRLASEQSLADKVRLQAEQEDERRRFGDQSRFGQLEQDLRSRGLSDPRINRRLGRERFETFSEQSESAAQEARGLAEQRREMLSSGDITGLGVVIENLNIANERAAEAAQMAINASNQRLAGENQIFAQRSAAADADIAASKQRLADTKNEISLRQEAIERDRQRLMSAAERFGQLGTNEQNRLKLLKQRLDAGEQLSVAELKAVQSVGTEGVVEETSRRFQQLAREGGFFESFGTAETDRINAALQENIEARQQRGEIRVELRDQRELKVEIQRDDELIIQRINDEISDQMQIRDDALEEAIIARQKQETEDRIAAREAELAASQAVFN